ncbi:MAG: nuclear transport factor 2 family protein [Actinocatenispora sp.]
MSARAGPDSGLDDRTAVQDLVHRYFAGFDERRADRAWLDSIVTADVVVDFPVGAHRGLAELDSQRARILGLWDRTLHQVTNLTATVDGDRAELRAVLTATHVHRADDPGAHLHIGGHLDGDAVRTSAGWRLSRLALTLVWTEGDGPTPPRDA